MVANFIDEASRFHLAFKVREAQVERELDLGNINQDELEFLLRERWCKYFGSPTRILTGTSWALCCDAQRTSDELGLL